MNRLELVMRIKKIFPIFALVAIMNSISAYAKSSMILPEAMENILVFIFNTLPEGVRSESTVAVVYFKFLLWVFVFAAMYSALKKVMHNQNRVVSVAAFVISLSSVILIPNNIVITIFNLYGTIVAILLGLMPFLIIWFFTKKVMPDVDFKSKWIKGLLFILAALIILFLSVSIAESGNGEFYKDLSRWMEIGAVVCFFVGIIMFLEGAGSMVKGGSSSSSSSGGGSSSSPSGGSGSSGGGTGAGSGRPGYPNDLLSVMDSIQNMLEQYRNRFTSYEQIITRLLERNNDNVVAAGGHTGNPWPPGCNIHATDPTLATLLTYARDRLNELNRRQRDLLNALDGLFRNANFPRLNRADTRRATDLATEFATEEANTINFRLDAQNAYSLGERTI
jgi:uncharacterized membrane protein YgcG